MTENPKPKSAAQVEGAEARDEGTTSATAQAEDRAKSLVRLAGHYGIDPKSSDLNGWAVGEFLRDPASISRFVAVHLSHGEIGPGGEELAPDYFSLRASSEDLWEPVREEEEFGDHEWFDTTLIGVVDLDRWDILQRGTSGWSSSPLPD